MHEWLYISSSMKDLSESVDYLMWKSPPTYRCNTLIALGSHLAMSLALLTSMSYGDLSGQWVSPRGPLRALIRDKPTPLVLLWWPITIRGAKCYSAPKSNKKKSWSQLIYIVPPFKPKADKEFPLFISHILIVLF